jgi:hypothetical protein
MLLIIKNIDLKMYIEAMINSLALKQFIVCYLVLAE